MFDFLNKTAKEDLALGGAHMSIAIMINLARKLNIPPEEFADIMDLKEETMDYLQEVSILMIKKKREKLKSHE